MKKLNFEISEYELDQLKETVNIGASHASTALNQLIKRKVHITVPEVNIDNIEKSVNYIGNPDMIATIVLLKILGDTTGIMFYLFPEDNGYRLAKLITKNKDSKKVLTEYDRSALREVGNILSGACLTALSKFLGITLLHSVSDVATDMLGSIVNSLMAEVGRASDIALVLKVNLTIEDENIVGQLYFLTDPGFTDKILSRTKRKLKK